MSTQVSVHANNYAAVTADIREFCDEGAPDFVLLRVDFEQPIGWYDLDHPMEGTTFVVRLSIFNPEAFFAALDAARENFARRHEPPENGGPLPGDMPAGGGTAWAG